MHFTTLQKEASSFDSVTMDPSLSCIWQEIQFRPQRKEAVQFYFERQRVCSFQFETVFVIMFYDKRTMGARLQSLRKPSHNSATNRLCVDQHQNCNTLICGIVCRTCKGRAVIIVKKIVSCVDSHRNRFG